MTLSGTFESFYRNTGVPDPEPVEAGEEGDVPAVPVAPSPQLPMSTETQLVVVGSSAFVTDDFTRQFPTSRVFFLNTIDWLTMGGDLIGIRSRGVADRPLKEIYEGAKRAVKFLNVFAIPILVILYGLVRVYARRRARKLYGTYGV